MMHMVMVMIMILILRRLTSVLMMRGHADPAPAAWRASPACRTCAARPSAVRRDAVLPFEPRSDGLNMFGVVDPSTGYLWVLSLVLIVFGLLPWGIIELRR